MPHAVDEVDLQGERDDAEIARILDGSTAGRPEESLEFLDPNRELDAGEKADDAQDFEDIDDDDLASEEDERPSSSAHGPAEHAGDAAQQSFENAENEFGFEADIGDDDLFGEGDDAELEFESSADRPRDAVSPVDADSTMHTFPPVDPTAKLPSVDHKMARSELSKAPRQNSPANSLEQPLTSSVKSGPRSHVSLEPDEEQDPLALMQQRLFARDYDIRPESKLESFYDIWPMFDPDETPRFAELFPPMPAAYNWKVPAKPPKILHPSKLTLDIRQDTERAFRAALPAANVRSSALTAQGEQLIVHATTARDDDCASDDSLSTDDPEPHDRIGGIAWEDIQVACQDWELESMSNEGINDFDPSMETSRHHEDHLDLFDDSPRPVKRPRRDFDIESASAKQSLRIPLDDPELSTARLSQRVTLDLNDPDLLLDQSVSATQSKSKRAFDGARSGVRNAMIKELCDRYNVSNDLAYELLKENHQHKVRSTLGNVAIEHSLPATKLQYPFYQVKLNPKQLRSFHRPRFTTARVGKENRFTKSKSFKRKQQRGKEVSELFATSEDLSMGDNSNGLFLEYSEEMPIMLSNFGMGNRIVNYYRRKDEQDASRPREDVGETQILLPQDRSPFSRFGQVGPGETVPTFQNSLYRAPIFKHEERQTDFIIISNSNAEYGTRYYLRNMEHVYTVGQQFPSKEVPAERAKPVNDAAKRRLQALSFRIWRRWTEGRGPPVSNKLIQEHLPGSDIPANRSRMHEFMQYHKDQSMWLPKEGEHHPSKSDIQAWIKPDDLCLIESTQVGLQHLSDLGLRGDDDLAVDDDMKEGTNIEMDLAPWTMTKNFLNACQGKAMLKLHGEGDPTGRGEGFSFVKTSMKGGFRALGESIEERLDAKRLKENNGHSYNVAKQQRAYDESIRRVWKAQQDSLSSAIEHSDNEGELEAGAEADLEPGATPRTAYGTPAPFGREDESASQYSRASADRKNQTLVIMRTTRDNYGKEQEIPVTVTDQRVINAYKRAKYKEQSSKIEYVFCHL